MLDARKNKSKWWINIFWCRPFQSICIENLLYIDIYVQWSIDWTMNIQFHIFTFSFALQRCVSMAFFFPAYIPRWSTERYICDCDGKHLCHLICFVSLYFFFLFCCRLFYYYYFHFGIKPELNSPNFAYEKFHSCTWKKKKTDNVVHTLTHLLHANVSKIRSLTKTTQSHLPFLGIGNKMCGKLFCEEMALIDDATHFRTFVWLDN